MLRSKSFYLLVGSLFFIYRTVLSQEIKNYPIKIGISDVTTLEFSEVISKYSIRPSERFVCTPNESRTAIDIEIDERNKTCPEECILTVEIKKKVHAFRVICENRPLNDEELVHKFTDSKKIKDAIVYAEDYNAKHPQKDPVPASTASTSATKETSPQAPNGTSVSIAANSSNTTSTSSTVPSESASGAEYNSLLGQAYADFSRGNYKAASELVEKALKLKPGEASAVQLKKDVDIKLAEQNAIADQARKRNYYLAYADGEKSMGARDYDKAETYFLQAKAYEDPGNTYVDKKLAEVALKKKNKAEEDRKIRVDQERQENYKNAVHLADMALEKSDYEYAKQQYRLALTYKDQDTYANNKIIEIDTRIAKEKRDREQQAILDKYNTAKSAGDAFLAGEQFDSATAAYKRALMIIPGDTYANAKLKDVQTAIVSKKTYEQQQLKQRNYDENILLADAAFEHGDYTTAMEKYAVAAKWLPSQTYPSKKITEIKTLQKETALKAEQERQAAIKQKKLENDYVSAIGKADAAFDKQDLTTAKKYYKDAVDLKPYEQYPQSRIADIDSNLERLAQEAKARKDSIDALNAKKAKYNTAIAKGNKAITAKDYPTATEAYNSALSIFDTAGYAMAQLALIERILAEKAAREKAIQDSIARVVAFEAKFDSLRIVAATAMKDEDFDLAIAAIGAAVDMKPADDYVKGLYSYAQQRKKDKSEKDATAKLAAQYEEYRVARSEGNKALREKRYADARMYFGKALTLMEPDRDYGSDKEYFINKLNAIDIILAKEAESGQPIVAAAPVVVATPPPASAAKKDAPGIVPAAPVKQTVDTVVGIQTSPAAGVATSTIQPEAAPVLRPSLQRQDIAIPLSADELGQKYPGVDFTAPPAGQSFNMTEYNDTSDAAQTSRTLLGTAGATTGISAAEGDIGLLLESIYFNAGKAYFQFKIQNYSSQPFLAGVMKLIWEKKDGNQIVLNPGYISSYPVVLPLHEYRIVYTIKAAFIDEGDALSFTLRDRDRLVKMSMKIPGELYRAESNK